MIVSKIVREGSVVTSVAGFVCMLSSYCQLRMRREIACVHILSTVSGGVILFCTACVEAGSVRLSNKDVIPCARCRDITTGDEDGIRRRLLGIPL